MNGYGRAFSNYASLREVKIMNPPAEAVGQVINYE